MFLAALILALSPPPDRPPSLEALLDAIQVVETGSEPHGGRVALGDDGRSIGPFQIQRAYWIDSRVPGRFEDCRDARYARKVVVAYWKRWCPTALAELDAECLARVHNGGPRGLRKAATARYWKKVEAELERAAILSTPPPVSSGATGEHPPPPRPAPRRGRNVVAQALPSTGSRDGTEAVFRA